MHQDAWIYHHCIARKRRSFFSSCYFQHVLKIFFWFLSCFFYFYTGTYVAAESPLVVLHLCSDRIYIRTQIGLIMKAFNYIPPLVPIATSDAMIRIFPPWIRISPPELALTSRTRRSSDIRAWPWARSKAKAWPYQRLYSTRRACVPSSSTKGIAIPESMSIPRFAGGGFKSM